MIERRKSKIHGWGVYATQVLPFADVKSLPLFYAFEKAVYDG